jgi:hypothetical protein
MQNLRREGHDEAERHHQGQSERHYDFRLHSTTGLFSSQPIVERSWKNSAATYRIAAVFRAGLREKPRKKKEAARSGGPSQGRKRPGKGCMRGRMHRMKSPRARMFPAKNPASARPHGETAGAR